MWPIKEKENRQLLTLWPNPFLLKQAVGMSRYGSLINISPSDSDEEVIASIHHLLHLVFHLIRNKRR